MKTTRLARSLATVVLAVGLLIGVTSPVNAIVYPPSRVGRFDAAKSMECTYNDDGTFSSATGFSFVYVVEVPIADFMVTREDGEVVHVETVEMGIHNYSYTPTGLEVFQSFTAEITGQIDSGWDVAFANINGCPVPDTNDVLDGGGSTARGAKAATPVATNAKPVTGSAPLLVGALAVALLAGGAVMLIVSRRRPATS